MLESFCCSLIIFFSRGSIAFVGPLLLFKMWVWHAGAILVGAVTV
jgi:hypothetical protein